MLTVVNMIPNGWSDEQNQDCEPNLSVNPANPSLSFHKLEKAKEALAFSSGMAGIAAVYLSALGS